MGSPKKRWNKKNIQKRLVVAIKRGCTISVACRFAGIGRTTFYEWHNEDEAFRKRMLLAREERPLLAEDKLFELGMRGDARALRDFLKGNSKKYKTEPTHINNTNINSNTNNFEPKKLLPEEVDDAVRKRLRENLAIIQRHGDLS